MERFNGVATKYIDNYLFWFRFLELHKQLDKNLRRKTKVLEACKQVNFMTTATLRAYKNQLIESNWFNKGFILDIHSTKLMLVHNYQKILRILLYWIVANNSLSPLLQGETQLPYYDSKWFH